MCLITGKRDATITVSDMTVWKVMDSNLKSMHRDFKYVLGKLNEAEIGFIDNDRHWIPYSTEVSERLKSEFIGWDDMGARVRERMLCIDTGFHSFTSKKLAIKMLNRSLEYSWNKDVILVECTIPKGAKRYEDYNKMAVSNELIINKIL